MNNWDQETNSRRDRVSRGWETVLIIILLGFNKNGSFAGTRSKWLNSERERAEWRVRGVADTSKYLTSEDTLFKCAS